ncbi:hypothetical protein OCS65_28745 (plasmid) [Rhodococcus aetherivorans]|uniref:Uncharacterized protein n=1 Tax=Rhodococcus aetherivorans TaxID=191292 RepID=A0AA46SCP4_9NOCA|nr:hypothetical protein [Rhodococcus aetherivorans]MDV6297296.1 hypothetical protein [Rhodococcus aetherivorans]UYF97248.1 hypothetical protein OCS65_28745 [Rhodococcus aetherivorans]
MSALILADTALNTRVPGLPDAVKTTPQPELPCLPAHERQQRTIHAASPAGSDSGSRAPLVDLEVPAAVAGRDLERNFTKPATRIHPAPRRQHPRHLQVQSKTLRSHTQGQIIGAASVDGAKGRGDMHDHWYRRIRDTVRRRIEVGRPIIEHTFDNKS